MNILPMLMPLKQHQAVIHLTCTVCNKSVIVNMQVDSLSSSSHNLQPGSPACMKNICKK